MIVGVLSVRRLARALVSQWCEKARLATVATVSLKCDTHLRSCEMRRLVMNKRGNTCCWLGSKPPNNKCGIMDQTDTLKYACCHGNHWLCKYFYSNLRRGLYRYLHGLLKETLKLNQNIKTESLTQNVPVP